jgi:hypothetical protein
MMVVREQEATRVARSRRHQYAIGTSVYVNLYQQYGAVRLP